MEKSKLNLRIWATGAALLLVIYSTFCSAQDPKSDAQSFWLQFQRAVTANDKAAVAAMTRFPLEVRGIDDSIPVIQCDRQCFDGIYERLLSQSVLFSRNNFSDLDEIPMHQLIVDAKTAPEFLDPEDTIMRFHDFEFEKTADGWRIVRAWLQQE